MTKEEIINEIRVLAKELKKLGGDYIDQTIINTKGESLKRIIIDYHNEYSKNKDTGNWHDFLMIIPLQMSAMITGLLIGVENKDNAISLRIHRELLGQFSLKVMEDLQKIKPINE